MKGENASLESLDRIHKILRKPALIRTLAFSGVDVMKDKVTFSSADLEALGVHTGKSSLGLIY